MTLGRTILAGWLMAACLMPAAVPASGPGIMQEGQGGAGRPDDLGGVRLQQDQRGTSGAAYDFGAPQQFQFTDPTGEPQPGRLTPPGGPRINPVLPLPPSPSTPVYPLVPYGGGMAPHSHPGSLSGRGTGDR